MDDRTVKGTLEWDVSDLLSGTDQGVQALRETADEADRTEQALADGFDEGVQATGRFRGALGDVHRDFSDLAGVDLGIDLADEGREFSRLSDRVDEVGDAAGRVGREVGDELSDGMDRAQRSSGELTETVEDDTDKQRRSFSQLRESLGEYTSELGDTASLAGAGALGAVTIGLDNQRAAAGRLQAQMGLTADETERVGDVAKDVFTSNFGETLEDAGDTVALLAGSIRDVTDPELKLLAEGVIAVEDAFGHVGADVPIIIEDLRALAANFPGTTELELLDMIVDAFQEGTGNSGDLQDTLQEYPGDFARVGLSADDMFGILNAGMEAGVRNTDLVADGVREMAIRVTEEGGEASAALADLFPPDRAAQIREDMAAGGEAGRTAFFDIAEALAAVNDPLAQNEQGVKLMGTRWEDVQNQMPTILGAMADVEAGTHDASGATEDLNAQYDHASSKLEGWKRELSVGTVGILGDFAGSVAEVGTGIGGLALGAQGLGVDLRGLTGKVRGFSWGDLPRGAKVAAGVTATAVAAGLLGKAIADATDVSQGDLSTVADGLVTLAEVGESRQLDAAIGGVDGLGVSLGGIADPSLWENVQGGFSDTLNVVGSMFGVDGTWAQARQDISATDDALAQMAASGNADQAAQLFDQITEAAEREGVSLDQVRAAMPRYSDAVDRMAAEQGEAADTVRDWNPLLEKNIEHVGGLVEPTKDLGEATGTTSIEFDDLTDAAATVGEAVSDLDAEFRELTGGQRDVRAASSDWHASLDGLTEAIDENGTTTDLATEKGRANEAAIQAAQIAAEDHALAVLEETESIDDANKVLDTHREDLHDVLVQSGMSRKEARKYTREIKRIPDDAKTKAEFRDAQARQRMGGYVRRIRDVPGQVETFAKLGVDDDELEGWLHRLSQLNTTITTRGSFRSSGGATAFHTGTDFFAGGPAIVNDDPGRIVGEFVHLPGGTAVTDSQASVDMMAAGVVKALGGRGDGASLDPAALERAFSGALAKNRVKAVVAADDRDVYDRWSRGQRSLVGNRGARQ